MAVPHIYSHVVTDLPPHPGGAWAVEGAGGQMVGGERVVVLW